jgi:hypothetical protein
MIAIKPYLKENTLGENNEEIDLFTISTIIG